MPPASIDALKSTPAPCCVVVGASVRAFAQSAARCGWQVHAADLFADADLAASASSVVRLGPSGGAQYPEGIPEIVARLPPGPCVYTGAVENHPATIAAVAAERPLAGCSAEVVRRVRDLDTLASHARSAGLSMPDTFPSPHGLPTDGTFLVKPVRSAGGHGIRRWRGDTLVATAEGRIWQRFVAGHHWSASYVAGRDGTRLVGTSRPIAPAPWCGGREFAYAGSVDAPLGDLADSLRRRFESLGASLAATGLVGLFGIDAIVTAGDEIYVLEVNPRPTASMELVERATGWSMAGAHLAAFRWGEPPPAGRNADGIWAKAVVFAPRAPCQLPIDELLATLGEQWTACDGRAALADIPRLGEPYVPGGPVVTVFARGESSEDTVARLRRRVLTLRRAIANRLSRRAVVA